MVMVHIETQPGHILIIISDNLEHQMRPTSETILHLSLSFIFTAYGPSVVNILWAPWTFNYEHIINVADKAEAGARCLREEALMKPLIPAILLLSQAMFQAAPQDSGYQILFLFLLQVVFFNASLEIKPAAPHDVLFGMMYLMYDLLGFTWKFLRSWFGSFNFSSVQIWGRWAWWIVKG